RPGRSYSPLPAWEPVVYRGARRVVWRSSDVSDQSTSDATAHRQDALVYVQRPRLTDPLRVIGAKPAAFCAWLFCLLGLLPCDELVDLFPGSGGVSASWQTYRLAAAQRDVSHVATRDVS